MITAGFDIGTRFAKVCIVDGHTILGFSTGMIGRNIDTILKTIYKKALDRSGIKKRSVKKIIATGFGSELVKAKYTVTESSCLARAVYTLNPKIRTVIDIGGLFINIITIGRNGLSEDSITNDKCAAGSGKFLEMIADVVEIPFTAISEYAQKSTRPYEIASSCAVFAESEVIGQLNDGMNSYDILAGVINSIVSRTITLIEQTNTDGEIVLIGGISKIDIFKKKFEEQLSLNISSLPLDSQIVAAYGAALLARDD